MRQGSNSSQAKIVFYTPDCKLWERKSMTDVILDNGLFSRMGASLVLKVQYSNSTKSLLQYIIYQWHGVP